MLRLEASPKDSSRLDPFDLRDAQTSPPLLFLFLPSLQKYTVRFISGAGKMRSVTKIDV